MQPKPLMSVLPRQKFASGLRWFAVATASLGLPGLCAGQATSAQLPIDAGTVLSEYQLNSHESETPVILPSAYWATIRSHAILDLVQSFNQIANTAGKMRSAMRPWDADAFDAIMIDIMAALAAIPGIAVRQSSKEDLIRPPHPAPEHLSQLDPDLRDLAQFFERIQKEYPDGPTSKLFCRAATQSRKMRRALPEVLPVIAVQRSGVKAKR